MSEVAGILSIQVGARGLEKGCGGRGVLLSASAGSPPGNVTVLGAGVAGRNAARIAAGIGANVTILDLNPEKLALANRECGGKARTILSTPEAVAGAVKEADLLVSTVLVAGERAPRLITREMIRSMRPGAVVVDIAIDQGGSIETSRPTTHAAPYFVEERVVHYCVTNMPAAVPCTSTQGLVASTLPYLLSFARHGVAGALRSDVGLLAGLNTHGGHVTCEGVAKAFGKSFLSPGEAIR
jgi:alanine dehydrogenase